MPRLLLTCLALTCVAACLPGARAEPVTIAGTVVGPDEQPLPEAEVWLLHLASSTGPQKVETVATVRADAAGKFRFEPVELVTAATRNLAFSYLVYALKGPLALGNQGVGPAGVTYLGPAGQAGIGSASDMRIACPAAVPIAAQVVSAQDQALVATVCPYGTYSPELRERLTVRSGADGKFVIDTMGAAPPGRSRMLEITAPGYGRVRVGGGPTLPPVIKLQRAGSLEIVFTRPAEAAATPFAAAQYYGKADGWPGTLSAALEIDEHGLAKVPELPPGTYTIAVENSCASPWQYPRREVQVKTGEPLRVEMATQRGVPVTGKVFATDTGLGIPGVGVSSTEGRGAPVLTDKDGKYTLYALPGNCFITLRTVPDEYVRGNERGDLQVKVTETGATADPVRLQRARTVEGVAVDAQGQPVAGATIHYPGEYDYAPSSPIPPVISDEGGKFTLKRLAGGRELSVWAEKDELVAGEVTFDPAQPPQPLKLVLTPLPRCRLKLKVVDQDGKPVTGASIGVGWWTQHGGGRPNQMTARTADATGEWLSDPQIGFGTYMLNVTCPGYDSLRLPQWQAQPGETHDFGVLRLTRANGSIAGLVTDEAGKPLAGVNVFNSSETPNPAQMTTGPDGRFALNGLFPGKAFVFAEAPGRIFGGVCAETGATEVVVKLVPRPEVKGLVDPAPPPTPRADELEAARALIDLAMATAQDGWYGDLVGLLATLDLPAAIKVAAADAGPGGPPVDQSDDLIAAEMGKALIAADDPIGALEWFEKIDSPDRYALMQAYAVTRLAPTHPDLAQQHFEKAMELLPALNDRPRPVPSLYMARMALALYPVDRELAERAARKAQEIVNATVPKDQESGQVRPEVAEALALFDVEAALEMVKDIPDWGDRMAHYERWVAAGCARVDPARAEAIMKMAPSEMTRNNDLLRVLYAMVQTDPERAVRLARAISDQRVQRPMVLAWLAYALRAEDRPKSSALFEEAVGCLKQDELRQYGWPGGRAANLVALLAAIGRKIGYPLSAELAWRAAALRPPATGDTGNWYMDQQVVALLALSEPTLAKDAALSAAQRVPTTEEEWSRSQRLAGIFTALALADPAGAPETVAALLRDHGGKLDPYAWAQVIRTLLADSGQRLGMVARRGEGWAPNSDDLQW